MVKYWRKLHFQILQVRLCWMMLIIENFLNLASIREKYIFEPCQLILQNYSSDVHRDWLMQNRMIQNFEDASQMAGGREIFQKEFW